MNRVILVVISLTTLAAHALALRCSTCIGVTGPGCIDSTRPCGLFGDGCFKASGKYYNGSAVIFGYLKGCAPCTTPKTACDFLNRTAIKVLISLSAYLVSCDLQCCKGNACNTGPFLTQAPSYETTQAITNSEMFAKATSTVKTPGSPTASSHPMRSTHSTVILVFIIATIISAF